MAQNDAARNRYAASFTSNIFEPPEGPGAKSFVPAGKRRDQSTSELFGSYVDKDLKSVPKTFQPKDMVLNARQKKQQFLTSEVLPCSSFPPEAEPVGPPKPRLEDVMAAAEANEQVDTAKLRHQELSSTLFGRPTPATKDERIVHRSSRLTPNDFTWHSHPEAVQAMGSREVMSHAERAYQEKCSNILNHQTPDCREDPDGDHFRRSSDQEEAAEMKRRHNVYYSDLFDRPTPMVLPGKHADAAGHSHGRRPKHQGSCEDQIVVHQDWTDSKTELMRSNARGARSENPALRKSDELHQARIFGESAGDWKPPEKLDPVTHDNSSKTKAAFGRSTQQIHQAHLRSSIGASDYYEEASGMKDWEVMELFVSGLPSDADDDKLRRLCQGFDLQIVKVAVELDPVRNLCKGRAKVMVRYNPSLDSIQGLVAMLQDANLRVDV